MSYKLRMLNLLSPLKQFNSLLIFLLLFCTHLSAQKNVDPTPEHIALANSLKETYPDDEVVILQSNEKISFNISREDQQVTADHALEQDLINIAPRADIPRYVFYDDKSEVNTFKVKLRNNKTKYFPVQDEYYEKEDIFYHDARVKYMHIDFPVKGYKYRYLLEKHYKDIKYFTRIGLGDEYPILEKKVVFTIPDWLEVDLKEFHFDGYDIQKEKKYDSKAAATQYTYTISNVAAIPNEPNAPGPTYFHPHILIIAKGATINGEHKQLFSDTQQLYNWYKSLVDTMSDDSTVLQGLVEKLTKNTSSDLEKIKNIYYWVQDNIRYIAFEDGLAGFKPEECQVVLKNKYGDCKGMANLTKQMLKTAGFDARLSWIGTKRIFYDYSLPSLAVDNHMICTVFHEGNAYFLDSTEKYNSFGQYAERIQGRPVLIEDGDQYMLKKIPMGTSEENKESSIVAFSVDQNKLVGNVQMTYMGESKSHFLYNYNLLKSDKKEEALEYYLNGGDSNYLIKELQTSDLTDRDSEIAISYDMSLDNRVVSFDDEMYIDLEYERYFEDMDLSERKSNLEFPFKKDVEQITTLKIPEGYEVKELPPSLDIKNEDFEISVSFQKKNNVLIYSKHFIFKNALLTKSNFEKWGDSLKRLQDIYQQQIILNKK